MTPRARAATGSLRERLVESLHAAPRPLTGIELFGLMRASGVARFLSQTYRALGELHVRGAIRRVELTRSYAAGAENRVMNLVCRSCGKVDAVDAAGIVAALTRTAAVASFSPVRCIVELDGHCAHCTAA